MKTLFTAAFLFFLSFIANANDSKPLSCEFSKYKKAKEVLKFYSMPKIFLEYKKSDLKGIEYPQSESGTFREVGEVIAGPCKGAKLIVGYVEISMACGKSSGEPFLIYTASGVPATEPGLYDGVGECQGIVSFLSLDQKILLDREDHYLKENLSKLKPKSTIASAQDLDYSALLVPEKLTTFSGIMLESKLVKGDYPIDERLFNRKGYQIIFSSEDYGTVYLKKRRTFLATKDFRVVEVNLGLAEGIESYGYMGFLEDINKEKENIKTKINLSDLSAGDSKKERWIAKQNHSFLVREFDSYKERAGKIIEEVDNAIKNSSYGTEGTKDVKSATSLTFDEYFEAKPFLFKEDKLGRMQVFSKLLHNLPYWAEPLIYIYSQTPTKMKINFGPEVDVAVSIPKLINKWEFETVPPNKLKIGAKTYKTLFWEGVTAAIPSLREGWVLSPAEIPDFLDAELHARGLNGVEISDFKKYWVPQLTKSPYYRIEFLPEAVVDALCPIFIEPKPDTLIRVHMRVYPLSQFEESLNPVLNHKTVVRKGLTVVEWGGILSARRWK